jgi:uncharacterized protein YuzE
MPTHIHLLVYPEAEASNIDQLLRAIKQPFSYDREADVMYFYFDRPQKAKTIELDADFLLRLDPTTEETVGITVISFSRHFPFLRGQVPDEGEIETRDVMKALLAA